MLLDWIVQENRRRYPSMSEGQSIAYISDIGADRLKPLFIAGACVTTVFLDLSFVAERWLRHNGRLVPNGSLGQKILAFLTIVFAIVGTAGLILLSIFDTLRHNRLHDIFLLLFIAGYLLSAIFICWEYQRLGIGTWYFPSHCASTILSSSSCHQFANSLLLSSSPGTPHSPHLILGQTHLHPGRVLPRRHLRRYQLHSQLQCRRRFRMGCLLRLHPIHHLLHD